MAALTWNDLRAYLTIFDLKTGKIVQEEGGYPNTLDPAAGEPGEEVGADGPLYSPDGKTMWVRRRATSPSSQSIRKRVWCRKR